MQGDREAAEKLTRQTYRQVYAAILSWCRDRNLAEDLTQETYQKAWKALSTFRGHARFSTWLHRIAYTTFLNDQRNRKRQRPITEIEENELVFVAESPAEAARRKQRDQRLRNAIETLPKTFRTTLLAHYWSDLSVSDLAAAEGVSVVAIRKRLAKARSLMQTSLIESFNNHAGKKQVEAAL